MDLVLWVGWFAGLTPLTGWVVVGDGAEQTGGLIGAALLGADVGSWTEAGIRLFVGAGWVVAAVWFVTGLILPEARLGL